MRIGRIDLDGKGMGSPEGLVTAILKIETELPIPVPIEELCRQLDITDIVELETEGFEGALITDTERSSGIVMVNRQRPRQRQRFSIGHELGHFLIPTHMPNADGRFLCSRDDMARLTAKEGERRLRMEVEANRFASLILIPPPHFRKDLSKLGGADLLHINTLARRYDVSKDAMARAYARYHPELICIVVCKDGKVLRHYTDGIRFPYLQPKYGERVPSGSLYHRGDRTAGKSTEMESCLPDIWVNVERGIAAPAMVEQVYYQSDGYALLMLKISVRDEDDEDEERDLQRSWRVGFSH
jgi:hypothetical protein